MKTRAMVNGEKTHFDMTLPLAVVCLGKYDSLPDVVYVGNYAYYTHDFGGVWALSRWAVGMDHSGNIYHKRRVAPASLDGIADPVYQGTILCKKVYGEPKYWLAITN